MAHIEAQETNGSVVTFVRGRQYRPTWKRTPNALERTKTAAKKKRVCLLSSFAAKMLENWNVPQPCFGEACTHAHFTRDEVSKMVSAGDLRWVGTGENVAAWREARELRTVISAGMPVVQWVPVGS